MRIRTIKPEFWQHEIMAELPEFSRLLAIALLNYADDEGYFLASPQSIRGSLFPFIEDSVIIHGALTDLSRIGYVKLGRLSDGRAVGFVVKFKDHQVINRPQPSKFKDSSSFTESSVINHTQISDQSHTNHTQFTAGKEGNGKEGNGSSIVAKAPQTSDDLALEVEDVKPQKYQADFDVFWKEYPNKKGKAEANRSWVKMKPDLQTILTAIAWQKKSPQWTEKAGQYIPMPATYLNNRRWEDEHPVIRPPSNIYKGPSCL